MPWVRFDNCSSFILTGLFTPPSRLTRDPTSGISAKLPHVCFTGRGMEPGGGIGVVKPMHVDPEDVGLHETDSSELSASTASNTTLPQLEMTDAKKAQHEEDRRKRKAAREAKREAREMKEQQRLKDKKQRKEERKLKREARKKRREARKKEEEAKAINTSSSEISSSSKDRDDDESYQVSKEGKKEKKGKAKPTKTNIPPYPLTILLCL